MWTTHQTLVVLVFVLSEIHFTASKCVPIAECPAALKYAEALHKNELHNSTIQTLKDAKCGGFSGSTVRVFCERIPSCYSPSDENFCVKPKDCCAFLRLQELGVLENNDIVRKIRASRCGSGRNDIKIKCTSLLELERKIWRKKIDESPVDRCVTPSGLKGLCIPYQKCPTFSGQPVTTMLKRFFAKSICDHKNKRVCCNPDENSNHLCGVANSGTMKIIGGEPTHLHEFPWVVLLKFNDPNVVCGGSLISSQIVVTAGHCIRDDLEQVVVGGNFENNSRFDIIEIKLHPRYERRRLRFDIALLKIKPVSYQDSIKWMCLPKPVEVLPSNYIIVGKGETENGTLPQLQLKASVPLVHPSQCGHFYLSYLYDYLNWIICAGGVNGKDSCRGDSGGPLMSQAQTSEWCLYGIVSGGSANCSSGLPGFYTRVDKHISWIKQNMESLIWDI